jgi:hypothetical protein
MRCQHPFMKRDLAALEKCADRDRELLAAVAAVVQARAMAFAIECGIALDAAAMQVRRTTLAPLRQRAFFPPQQTHEASR